MNNLEILLNDEKLFTAEIHCKLEKYQLLICEFDLEHEDTVKDNYEIIILSNSLPALKKYMEITAKQRYPEHNFLWNKDYAMEYLSSDNNGEIELYYDRIPEKVDIDVLAINK